MPNDDAWQALLAALDVASSAVAPHGRAATGDAAAPLGDVVLAPHQQAAVAALQSVLDRLGVALLADATGLGKTFTALGVAAHRGGAQVIVPAAVVDAWRAAAARTGVAVSVHSSEQLSRRVVRATSHPLVILDEAHGFRNATTRRWRHAARLCRGRPLLLCTATPIHNAREELVTILRLAVGERAATWTDAQLQSLTVRRSADELEAANALPTVAPWEWWEVPDDIDVVAGITALPPALPLAPDDGRTPTDVLWRFGLLRAWASSTAALRVALRQRVAIAESIRALLMEGRRPTRATLRRWVGADGTVQPELPFAAAEVDDTGESASVGSASWLDVVLRHIEGLRALAGRVHDDTSDAQRCARVWAFVQQSTAPTLLFTHARATATMYWRGLRQHPGVAVLTAHGGRIASGPVRRDDLLRWLDPARAGAAARDPTRLLRLVIATDLASEGVNLHRAAQVVHADLPWTPARIAQRIGRVARIGAAHPHVAVAAFAPPAAGDATLRLDARLRRKRDVAARVLSDDRVARLRARVRGVARCAPTDAPPRVSGTPIYLLPSTGGARPGAVVAVVRSADSFVTYSAEGVAAALGTPPWTPVTAQEVAERLGDGDAPFRGVRRALTRRERHDLARCLDALRQSLADAHASAALTGGPAAIPPPWLALASAALRDTPRHQQVAARALLQEFRARLAAPLPAQVERVLGKAVRHRARGLAWLQRVVRIVRSAPVPSSTLSTLPEQIGAPVALWVVEADSAFGG